MVSRTHHSLTVRPLQGRTDKVNKNNHLQFVLVYDCQRPNTIIRGFCSNLEKWQIHPLAIRPTPLATRLMKTKRRFPKLFFRTEHSARFTARGMPTRPRLYYLLPHARRGEKVQELDPK
jgi:hypothetical protein